MLPDISTLNQELQAKIKRLSKPNVKSFLEEKIKVLNIPKLNTSDRLQGILCAIQYYQLSDKNIKSKSKLGFLLLAASSVEEFNFPGIEDLKRNISVHLGNFYISQAQFFEAATAFENALIQEKDHNRKALVFINLARCKLWLRDFSGVFAVSNKASELVISDMVFKSYLELVRARFFLLIGDYLKSQKILEQIFAQLPQAEAPNNLLVELYYLKWVAETMGEWKYRWPDRIKVFHEKISKYVSEQSLQFYALEEALFKTFYLFAKGKSPSTVTTRKLASLKRKIEDSGLASLTKVVLKFQNTAAKTDLDYRMVSLALRDLLLGAHDFTYQFLNVLWLDYLWLKQQKTEFARCEIEFRSYMENIKNEIASNIDSKTQATFWAFNQLMRIQNLKKQIKESVTSAKGFFES